MLRTRGFTLIELMIVVAIIAIIAAIAIPNLMAARLASNETAAIANVRSIASAQAQVLLGARIDTDNDGAGEYGLFRELSAAVGVRLDSAGTTLGKAINPPVLSGAFKISGATDSVSKSGYRYKIFIPSASGIGVAEGASLSPPAEADLAESAWCCYAWPESYANSGRRAFFVNQAGTVTTTDVPTYTAVGGFPAGSAGRAFKPTGDVGSVTGVIAVGTKGRDGQFWRAVQ